VTSPGGLERSIEWVLTAGVVASGLLLLLGLVLGQEPLLRAGVLLLMLTPVVRVLVLTLGLFLLRRNREVLREKVEEGLSSHLLRKQSAFDDWKSDFEPAMRRKLVRELEVGVISTLDRVVR